MTSVFITPRVRENAIGGISRVVEAQKKWLPSYDVEIVDSPELADVIAVHASNWVPPSPKQLVVAHCHGLYWHEYQWDKWAYAVNAEVINNLRRADEITVPSQWVAEAVRRDTWRNVQVIRHGVDLEEWELLESAGYVLWNKTRQDTVCDPAVVNILADMLPNNRFVTTFGSDTTNVKVVGTLPYHQHKEYIQHAGLYLCTARETFGIGTLEAMACGVPVVGWNYGGQAEFIRNGEHGWLVDVGDYDSLARAIEYCMSDRQKLGNACRALVEEKYQWKDVVKDYADLYARRQRGPRVSVIISSYNLKAYLGACVRSCLTQDYSDYEVIIVDDCSTDGSYELAQSLAASEPRVKVVKTNVNSNMPQVLNLGVRASSGEYILPLDADNMLPKGTLSVLAGELDRSREIDIAYGRVRFVLDDGSSPDTRVSGDGISRWPPDTFSYDAQMQHRNQIPSTAMYRRKWFDLSGGYRQRCKKLGEDPDFWCRVTTLGAKPAKVTDAVTLTYRMREDSRSNTNNEWAWEQWYPKRGFMIGGSVRLVEPTISVIIPVGPSHGVQGIEDALDSLYAQTFINWEAIVIDDTGGEINWLPSWAQAYKTDSKASGVSVARNIGLKHARGKFVLFLDADDYLDKYALEKMLAAWELGTYVYTDWYKVEDLLVRSVEHYSGPQMLHNLVHPISCLFPLDVIKGKNIQFNESMRVGEDWDFVLACMSAGLCGVHLDEALLYYRYSSGHNRNGLKDNIDELRKLMNSRWSSVMACGCQQKKVVVTAQDQLNNQMMSMNGNDLVLVEYTGASQGSITYTGPATGTSYRFGLSGGNNLRYVHKADAEHFVERAEFRLAQPVFA